MEILHNGISYSRGFLPNSGIAQSSTKYSVVSVSTLTAHVLFVTFLAMSNTVFTLSEYYLSFGCELILTRLDVKSNTIPCF